MTTSPHLYPPPRERGDVVRNAKNKGTIINKVVQIPERMELGSYLDEEAKRFTVMASGIVVDPKGIRI